LFCRRDAAREAKSAGQRSHAPAAALLRAEAREVTMQPRKIDKTDWTEFCDRVSVALSGKCAEIEIASPDLGDQPETQWLPFLGITYDRKDDLIEIAMTGM
jgi:hypothetical protein